MTPAVCQTVVSRLQGLSPYPALHVSSLALNLAPAQFDDLHVLVHEDCVIPPPHTFYQAMDHPPGGLHLMTWLPSAQATLLAPAGLPPRPLPLTPNLGYSDWVGAPCAVWIQFYTNWRHGALLLVDLAEWFDPANREEIEVSVLGPGVKIWRPRPWALLLWQASLVTNCAADVADPAVIRAELDKLSTIANMMSPTDWTTATARAQAYDEQYLSRLDGFHTAGTVITDYATARGLPDATRLVASPPTSANVAGADLDYGVLYDLRYALEALEAYHPGTVDPAMLAAVQGGTGVRPRQLWNYPTTAGNVGEVAFASAGFGIWDQVNLLPPQTWRDLQTSGRITVQLSGLPPEGYWSGLTQSQFATVFP
jgi:hypothetical protein